jgi:hypothetical protein
MLTAARLLTAEVKATKHPLDEQNVANVHRKEYSSAIKMSKF